MGSRLAWRQPAWVWRHGVPTTVASLSVLGTPVKMGSVEFFRCCLVPVRVLARWTAVGVEVERPQRSEDERP
jgi:hypothetical protein